MSSVNCCVKRSSDKYNRLANAVGIIAYAPGDWFVSISGFQHRHRK